MTSETKGFIYLVIGIALWSTAEVVIRSVNEVVPPIFLAWFRFTLGGVVLLGLLPMELKRRNLRITPKIVLHASWMSLLGIVSCGITFQMALIHAGAGVVATTFGAAPVMVFVFSRIFLGDPMTWPRFLGVVSGFIGICVLALSQQSATFSYIGLGYTLINTLCFALFTVFVKKYAGQYGGLPITALCFLFGAVYMFPLIFWEGKTEIISSWSAFGEVAIPVTYLAIGTTGFAYLFYFMGLEKVDATRAISVILLKPPLATLLAWLTLSEQITWNLALSMMLILGGLYMVNLMSRLQLLKKLRHFT